MDGIGSRVYEVFSRKVTAGAISRVELLRCKRGYSHVLLPSRATDVELPALMPVPPAALQAAVDRMVYTRGVAMGAVGSVGMMEGDVLPLSAWPCLLGLCRGRIWRVTHSLNWVSPMWACSALDSASTMVSAHLGWMRLPAATTVAAAVMVMVTYHPSQLRASVAGGQWLGS